MVQCLPHCCQKTCTFKAQAGKTSKVTTMAYEDIKETMAERERYKLKKEKCFPEYKKLRNKVQILVKKAI